MDCPIWTLPGNGFYFDWAGTPEGYRQHGNSKHVRNDKILAQQPPLDGHQTPVYQPTSGETAGFDPGGTHLGAPGRGAPVVATSSRRLRAGSRRSYRQSGSAAGPGRPESNLSQRLASCG